MATIKMILLTSKKRLKKDGTFPLAIRVTIKRVPNAMLVGYSVEEKYWNKEGSCLANKPKHPNYNLFQLRLDELKIKAFNVLLQLDRENTNWTFKEFKTAYKDEEKEKMEFFEYLEKYKLICEKNGQAAKVKKLTDLRNNLEKYHDKPTYFSDITIVWLKNLQKHYQNKGMVGRTYLREIRTIYNRAIIEKYAEKEDYPFGQWGFKLPSGVKKEGGLSITDIKLLLNYKANGTGKHWAIRMWLLLFYCIGMDWIVLCLLKVENVKGDRLDYIRSKTGRPFSIKLTKDALDIIEEFQEGKEPDDYLFGMIPESVKGDKIREKYYADNRRGHLVIKLTKIKKELGITTSLTPRTARYTWASIARNEMNVTTELIQDGLGHSDIKVTQGYTNTRENKAVDDLNKEMMEKLK